MKHDDEISIFETQLTPQKKSALGGLLIGFLIISLIAAISGGVEQYNNNKKIKASELALTNARLLAAAENAWIPNGYTPFVINSDIAQDPTSNPPCQSSLVSSGQYCWTYKIVTKKDCNKVIATMELTNFNQTVATVVGETDNVPASTPTVLEIDSNVSNDNLVDSNTKGVMKTIECK